VGVLQVSIFALRSGLLRVVQLSLLGSIYSNLLLVQGCAFVVGGLKFKQQSYSQSAAKTNVSLLLLAVLALTLPMVLIASNPNATTEALAADIASGALGPVLANRTNTGSHNGMLEQEGISIPNALSLSRFTSVLLLIVYALLVFYQLKTHSHLFEGREDDGGEGGDGEEDGAAEDDDPPVLGPWGAVWWALVVTVVISVLSEFIVAAIDGAAEDLGVPVLFIATILLPIVGNAAEHAAAIIFAKRNKMEVSLGQ
jgi:Ca2+:H+ antiporter